MRKGVLLFIVALLITVSVQAQISFGIKAGPDIASTTTKFGRAKTTTQMTVGWTGGVYAMIPVAQKLVFQPALLYQDKGGSMQIADSSRIKTKLHYLSLPIDLLFMPLMPSGNGAWIIGLGPYVAYGISSKQSRSSYDNSPGSDLFKYEDLKRPDAGINVQLGFELSNGLNLSAFADIGLLNIAGHGNPENYTRNKSFSLTLGYTFKRD